MTWAWISKSIEVYYIGGAPGIEKTAWIKSKIKQLNIEHFDVVKYRNGFWLGISGKNKVAVYDSSHMPDLIQKIKEKENRKRIYFKCLRWFI